MTRDRAPDAAGVRAKYSLSGNAALTAVAERRRRFALGLDSRTMSAADAQARLTMNARNAFYAQSGGVTAVINASACGVIETARANTDRIGNVYAGRNGILGALKEDLIDTSQETDDTIRGLRSTPGGAFGSCRYKLKSLDANAREYRRLIDVFEAHDIGYFFYNGGGDSQDTANKVAMLGARLGYPVTCIGIPKTVDNDLPFTDTCPGFGSVAKYVATSVHEAALDVASMCATSTKVFVLEVMGRHAGWIAAAGSLAKRRDDDAPHVTVLPEVPFEEQAFLKAVNAAVERNGYCVVVASEGARHAGGQFLADAGTTDAFGHSQLGGVAPVLARLVKERLGLKYHWAVADYLQRAARHIASATDVEQAYAVGRHAVELALSGANARMVSIVRESSKPYRWHLGNVPLDQVANVERALPTDFIGDGGFAVTGTALTYLRPLIAGEDYPTFVDGLPAYVQPRNRPVDKKLPPFDP